MLPSQGAISIANQRYSICFQPLQILRFLINILSRFHKSDYLISIRYEFTKKVLLAPCISKKPILHPSLFCKLQTHNRWTSCQTERRQKCNMGSNNSNVYLTKNFFRYCLQCAQFDFIILERIKKVFLPPCCTLKEMLSIALHYGTKHTETNFWQRQLTHHIHWHSWCLTHLLFFLITIKHTILRQTKAETRGSLSIVQCRAWQQELQWVKMIIQKLIHKMHKSFGLLLLVLSRMVITTKRY